MLLEMEKRGVNMMNLIEKDMSLFCIAAILDMKQELHFKSKNFPLSDSSVPMSRNLIRMFSEVRLCRQRLQSDQ